MVGAAAGSVVEEAMAVGHRQEEEEEEGGTGVVGVARVLVALAQVVEVARGVATESPARLGVRRRGGGPNWSTRHFSR